jgi:hypothetical protein
MNALLGLRVSVLAVSWVRCYLLGVGEGAEGIGFQLRGGSTDWQSWNSHGRCGITFQVDCYKATTKLTGLFIDLNKIYFAFSECFHGLILIW